MTTVHSEISLAYQS